jgi:PKD repeat protein
VVTVSNLTSHEGEVVAVQVQATDADGDALVFAATGLPAGITMSAAGAISGTLSYATAGTYQGVVTVTDAKGLSGSASFVWTVIDVNRAPTVTAANQTSHEDDTVSVQIAGQDPDGDAITYAATGLPLGLTLNGGTGLITGHLDFESAGTYTVTLTATDAHALQASTTFTWTVTDVPQTPSPAGAAQVRHAPTLNGNSVLTGSLQIMSGESFSINGGKVTGNLFLPGTPTVQINSTPAHFGGTLDGEGSAAPAGYVVTLNGGTWLDHLVRRTNPAALPTVAVPPGPSGSRSVSLNNSNDQVGSFSTVRDLTLNGHVAPVTVPAGTYGSFIANNGNSFVLGVAGATTPAVYNFQSLTLNSGSRITIVGPVVITLRNGLGLSGSIGDPAHPEWLTLGIASGGLELNSGVSVAGYVIAPSGSVIIDGNSQLLGGVAADRLILNSGALLTLVTQ